MVAHLDAVLLVDEADNAVSDLARLTGREHMLKNLDDTETQLGLEALENQVRVALRDGTAGRVRDVGSEDNIVQGEAGCGTVREMGNGEGGGGTTVLMQQDHIGQSRRGCAGDKIGQNEVTTVETDGGGEEQANLFGESTKTSGG